MRALLVLCLTVLAACQSNDSDPGVCERAMEAYHQALQEAADVAPSCQADSDCVIYSANVLTCPVFRVTDCGQVVHHVTAARFDSNEIQSRICKAAGSGAIRCSIEGSCASLGTPACDAGKCGAR